MWDEERYWQEPIGGAIELDETMFGGRRKGKRGWGVEGKIIAFGIYKRNGRVKVFAVPDREKDTLIELVERVTRPGSLYYTDDYQAYATLGQQGEHIVVKKEKACPGGEITSMELKDSGATPRTGCIPIEGYRRKTSIFAWGKSAGASTTGVKAFFPC